MQNLNILRGGGNAGFVEVDLSATVQLEGRQESTHLGVGLDVDHDVLVVNVHFTIRLALDLPGIASRELVGSVLVLDKECRHVKDARELVTFGLAPRSLGNADSVLETGVFGASALGHEVIGQFSTVRVVFQSESYGPIRQESFPVKMNDDTFTMGGSHVQYVDYDRDLMADFMNHDGPASDMVVGVGNMIKEAYNLKGERIGPRASDGPTAVGAHYGNCDADGNYVVTEVPHETDWFFQSFCSAHLEQKHQWGEGIGLEDDIFMTLEEWINYKPGSNFVGLAVSIQHDIS